MTTFMRNTQGVVTGGYIGIIMSEKYLREKLPYFDNLESRMRELEEAGVWRIAEREVFDNYMTMHDDQWKGVRFVLQMNEDKTDALARLNMRKID